MKRMMILAVVLAICLTGCGQRDTIVYIPEEAEQLGEGIVVQIPVKPTEEAESQPMEPSGSMEPEETEPEQTNSATISRKPASSSNKGSSGNKNNGSNTATITGGSQKPPETQPPTADGKNQGSITIPAATESPETDPNGTEPAETEAHPTEPPATEPAPTAPPLYDISGYTPGVLEYAILDQINAHRADAELPELAMDERLSAIASCRSYEVSLVWSHTRPDGRSFATVLDDYGYAAGDAEELLVYALGFADGTAMADRWMQSDSHREILLGSWSAAGIGVYDANGYIYVTCLLIG